MSDHTELREIPMGEETVFQGVLINVSHMQVKLPDGRTSLREIVRHNGGVGIIPVDDQGNVTLVRQHRVSLDLLTLEVPAGKLDSKEEEPLLAARRELEEETGLHAQRMEFLTAAIPTPGYCTERLFLYLATGLSQHVAHLDPDEFLGVVKMPLEEACARVMSGEISDAKTALGLMMAREKLRMAEPAPDFPIE